MILQKSLHTKRGEKEGGQQPHAEDFISRAHNSSTLGRLGLPPHRTSFPGTFAGRGVFGWSSMVNEMLLPHAEYTLQ